MQKTNFYKKQKVWKNEHEQALACYHHIRDCLGEGGDRIDVLNTFFGEDFGVSDAELKFTQDETLVFENKSHVFFAYHPTFRTAKQYRGHSSLVYPFWKYIEVPKKREEEEKEQGCFQNLTAYVLAYMLTFCGCVTVSKVAQVCKHWNQVACHKNVWIPRLQAISAPIEDASCQSFFRFCFGYTSFEQLHLIARAWLYFHSSRFDKDTILHYKGLRFGENDRIDLHVATTMKHYSQPLINPTVHIQAKQVVCMTENNEGAIVWVSTTNILRIASIKASRGYVNTPYKKWIIEHVLPFCDYLLSIKF